MPTPLDDVSGETSIVASTKVATPSGSVATSMGTPPTVTVADACPATLPALGELNVMRALPGGVRVGARGRCTCRFRPYGAAPLEFVSM